MQIDSILVLVIYSRLEVLEGVYAGFCLTPVRPRVSLEDDISQLVVVQGLTNHNFSTSAPSHLPSTPSRPRILD